MVVAPDRVVGPVAQTLCCTVSKALVGQTSGAAVGVEADGVAVDSPAGG